MLSKSFLNYKWFIIKFTIDLHGKWHVSMSMILFLYNCTVLRFYRAKWKVKIVNGLSDKLRVDKEQTKRLSFLEKYRFVKKRRYRRKKVILTPFALTLIIILKQRFRVFLHYFHFSAQNQQIRKIREKVPFLSRDESGNIITWFFF